MRFTTRLALVLCAVAIIPMLPMGYFGYMVSQNAALDRLRSHVAGVNALKRADLQRWLTDLGATLESRAQRPSLRGEAAYLAESGPRAASAEIVRTAILRDHLTTLPSSTGFDSLSVIRAGDGLVLASSSPTLVGLSRAGMVYFQQGLLGTYVDRVRISALTSQPELHVATPILDLEGQVIAVLAGHADLSSASGIMRQSGGLGLSEESYLLDNTQHLVTALRVGNYAPLKAILNTTPARACAAGQQGIATFESYDGKIVIGAYAPVGEAGLCLVTEIDRTEVVSPIYAQRNFALTVGLVIGIMTLLVALTLARFVHRMARELTRGARTFGEGDLSYRVPAIGPPEVRELADALNAMAAQRQRVEARLAETTGLVQTIIEGAPVGIVTYRANGQTVWVNQAATEVIGLPREFMMHENFRTIPAWRDSGLLVAAERVLTTGHGERLDAHMLTSTSKEVWLECYFERFLWAGEQHVLFLATDRSERVRDQEELERYHQHLEELVAERTAELSAANRDLAEGQATLRALVDATPDRVVLTDVAGRVHIANAAVGALSHCAPEALVGAPLASLLSASAVPQHLKAIEQALATRAPVRFEENSPGYIGENTICPVLDAAGQVVGLAHFGRDVTSVRLAQQERLRTLAEQAAILDAMSDGLFVMDAEGRVRLVNRALLALLDVTPSDLIGQGVSWLIAQFVAEDEKPIATKLLEKTQTGIDVALDALTLTLPYDRRLVVSMRTSRLFDAQGQLQGIILTMHDQTAIERARQELERSNRELEQFAYVASHDLQEPLRMVSSYTQLLARRYQGKLDADADEFIHFAVDGANRMQHLINDLLSLSRVNTRGRPLVPVSAEGPLLRAIEGLRLAIQEQGAQITYDPLPTVLADEPQLVQLFQNLISNAIKFRRSGVPPMVHISATLTEAPRRWRIAVHDNGIGIEQQYHERIFQLFQRLHGRDEYPGTGIGLAVCRRIIERHGGTIEVESTPGEGTTFSFTLQGA